jgi:C-8 sterol isomerase
MDPAVLNASVQRSLAIAAASDASGATNSSMIISTLLEQLVEQYPDAAFATDFTNPREWLFSNAGGAMGSMFLIHASITE